MLAEQVDQSSWDVQVDIDQVLDKISLFGGLSSQQLKAILPHTKRLNAEEGEVIFQQGHLPCNVYVVLKGKIRMDLRRDDNSLASINYIAGDCFGESAVVGIQPQLGTTIVVEDCELLVISRTCLMDIVNTNKELFGMLMMNVAREVSRRLHAVVTSPLSDSEYHIVRA